MREDSKRCSREEGSRQEMKKIQKKRRLRRMMLSGFLGVGRNRRIKEPGQGLESAGEQRTSSPSHRALNRRRSIRRFKGAAIKSRGERGKWPSPLPPSRPS